MKKPEKPDKRSGTNRSIVKTEAFDLVEIEQTKSLELTRALFDMSAYYEAELPAEKIKLYLYMLDEFSLEQLREAFEVHIKQSDFFPKISQIIKIVKELNPPRMISRQSWFDKQKTWTRHDLDPENMRKVRREKIQVSASVRDLLNKIGRKVPPIIDGRDSINREKRIAELRRQAKDMVAAEDKLKGGDDDETN